MNKFLNKGHIPSVLDIGEVSNVVPKVTKKFVKVLEFNYENFYFFDLFSEKTSSVFLVGYSYSVICRVAFLDSKKLKARDKNACTTWKMLGLQVGLCISTLEEFEEEFYNLHVTLINQLESSMDIYKYKGGDIIILQLLIYRTGTTEGRKKISKFNVKSLGEQSDLINVSETKEVLNKLIPLTNKYAEFGVLLEKKVENNTVKNIILSDGCSVNFLDRINKYLLDDRKVDELGLNTSFYQRKVGDRDIIVSVVNSEFDSNNTYIKVYDISGMSICKYVDEKLGLNHFVRKVGNVIVYIGDKGIYKRNIELKFNYIKVKKYNKTSKPTSGLQPNWKIGTLDIETFELKDENKSSKAYALGFYVKGSTNLFYIKNLDSDKLIMECIDSMLTDKYNGYTFYVHNFDKYDSYFILGVIIDVTTTQSDVYDYSLNFNNDKILRLTITKKVKCVSENGKEYIKRYNIKIVDSLNFLAASLDKLCKTFDTEIKKSYFPYSYVNINNLEYIGDKPNIEHYKHIIKDEYNEILEEFGDLQDPRPYTSVKEKFQKLEERKKDLDVKLISLYKNIPPKNWSLKDETLKYLEKDLISLYNVIEKFSTEIFINHHVHVSDSLTISSLSMNIFLNRFYKNNIPLINNKSIYTNIKESYFGGITEVYKPYGKKLYYYDVNSLYPYSALNTMPGLNCVYEEDINKNIRDIIKDLFGFYFCKIKTSDKYIGLLPFRDKQSIIMPTGEWEGWYFSEELKFAYENGYEIQIISGYHFEKKDDVFSDYVHYLYNIKSTTNDPVLKAIAKSLLNNLLGKFGLDINKYESSIFSEERLGDIIESRRIRGIKEIAKDKYLVSYDVEVSKDICEQHGLDYKEEFAKSLKTKDIKVFKETNFTDVSVAISSAVTAYSRIYMNKIKLDILNKGGSIYYTDTDSIVTDIKLDDSVVGKDLGKFKLEHVVEEGYFISNKTYALKKTDGSVIIKNKGSDTKSLTIENFRELYLGIDAKAIRYESKRDYFNRSVTIKIPNEITLSAQSYKKRIRIFNENNIWIDTKPTAKITQILIVFNLLKILPRKPINLTLIFNNLFNIFFFFKLKHKHNSLYKFCINPYNLTFFFIY